MYSKYIKRPLDFFLSFCTIIALSPLFLLLTIVGAIKLKGNPFFTELRLGKDEKIFRLIKFRTMIYETDDDGNSLPDERRLVPYGKFLRSTSLDELPELFNILKGDMAIVGPQPLLVRDTVFMTPEQRKRYTVRQGLTGLAQIGGSNIMVWKDKLDYDLRYIQNIDFFTDCFIILMTLYRFFKKDDITKE